MNLWTLLIGTFVLGSTFGIVLAALLVQPFGPDTLLVAYGLGLIGALIFGPRVERRA